MANRMKSALLGALAVAATAAAIPQAVRAAPATVTPAAMAALLDRMQIEDMEKLYYAELTGGSVPDIGKYFTDDATMLFDGRTLTGRAAIAGMYATGGDRRVLPTNAYTMILSNLRTSVDGDTATFDAIWTGYLCDNVKSTPRLVEQGTDHTILRKQGGTWKIVSRAVQHLGGG